MSANLWPAQMPRPTHQENYWEEEDRIHHINGEWRGYYNLGYGRRWLQYESITKLEDIP